MRLVLGSRAIKRIEMHVWGAPFSLQRDAFSCHDARDFNSECGAITRIHEAFTHTGGCATMNPASIRCNFAIAKLG